MIGMRGSFARVAIPALTIAAIACVANVGLAQQAASSATLAITYSDQGWSAADRDAFYTTSQGSHMMRYAWFKALRRLDADQPFAGDQLQRYGYLPNERSKNNPEGLPIGFVIVGNAKTGDVGMSCAACHTAQLEYQKGGVAGVLRIDGGPTNADFQQFLLDLTAASRATLAQPERFDAFAHAVLSKDYSAARAARLKAEFGDWVKEFGEFMDHSLPASRWGPGRLDAFGMIFNRVAARDLGVAANFKTADAPVSYPFVWNASRQDHTQWTGSVPNGSYLQALARNTGEVLGVFGISMPRKALRIVDFRRNSIDFGGLQTLEEKIAMLRPPPWPREIFGLDEKLAERGKALFQANCSSCHAERARPDIPNVWVTPVQAVGTDPRMARNADREADPGLLAGTLLPPPAVGARFTNPAKAHDVLAAFVIGSAAGNGLVPESGAWRAIRKDSVKDFRSVKPPIGIGIAKIIRGRLVDLFKPVAQGPDAAYEARVLHGIWATAPYLHNGSVPNLWELLTPAKRRRSSFMVGSRVFDPKNVGYRIDQSPFTNGTFVADPMNANGNGNGGHEYGTDLPEDDRWALIEYLKTL